VKRFLLVSMLSTVALLSASMPAQATAAQSESGFSFQQLPDNTAEVLKCLTNCSATNLVIPDTLGSMPVSKIADAAFRGDDNNYLQGTLTLPASIVEIGANAFSDNELTGALSLPRSVTKIGASAFALNSFSTLTLPPSIVAVGKSAFSNNKITNLTIPSWMRVVPDDAFSYNPLLALTIAEGVETVGVRSFYHSTGLMKNIALPKSIKKLSDRAFGYPSKDVDRRVELDVFFMGKAPSFSSPKYRIFEDSNEGMFTVIYGKANATGFVKFDYGSGCRKDCFYMTSFVSRPDLQFTAPIKPNIAWARLKVQNWQTGKGWVYFYAAQLSGNIDTNYSFASKPGVFSDEDQGHASNWQFDLPPVGFTKDRESETFIWQQTKDSWNYFEFKPQRNFIVGERLIGSITLADRQKLPQYTCKWGGARLQFLICNP